MNYCDTLADGTLFNFWEKECKYTRELFVNQKASNASDENDGSREVPFKTIQAAADRATAGIDVGNEYCHHTINTEKMRFEGTDPYFFMKKVCSVEL